MFSIALSLAHFYQFQDTWPGPVPVEMEQAHPIEISIGAFDASQLSTNRCFRLQLFSRHFSRGVAKFIGKLGT